MKEFLLSCAYGVLAGALVGTATLALSDNPDDNYNNIAKGASLGLYAGMLLGVYVVYGVPEETPAAPRRAMDGSFHQAPSRLALHPLLNKDLAGAPQVDGLMLNWQVARF